MIKKPTSLTPAVKHTTPTLGSRIFETCSNLALFARHPGESVSTFFTSSVCPVVWDELRVEGVGTWDHICLAQHLTVDTLLGPHKEKPCQAGDPRKWNQESKAKQHVFTKNLQKKVAHFIRFVSVKLCKAQSLVGRWVPATTNLPVMALFNGEWLPRNPSACLPVRAYVRSILRCRCPC